MKLLRNILLVLLATAYVAIGQSQHYNATHLSLSDGLSQSSVMGIVQDEKGFIWMSTQDGLNRYDGTKFKVCREEPFDSTSISSNNTGPLHIDSKGRLWVGTINHGLNLYNEITGNFIHFKSTEDINSISGNLITDITEDGDGNLWIGTATGLNRLVETTNKSGKSEYTFERIPLLNSANDTSSWDHIFSIYHSTDNKLWVGTYGGLFRIDIQQPLLPEPTAIFFSTENESLSSDIVWEVTGDEYGKIWVGTRKGIDVLDRSTGEIIRSIRMNKGEDGSIATNLVHKLLFSSTGDLWVACLGSRQQFAHGPRRLF